MDYGFNQAAQQALVASNIGLTPAIQLAKIIVDGKSAAVVLDASRPRSALDPSNVTIAIDGGGSVTLPLTVLDRLRDALREGNVA